MVKFIVLSALLNTGDIIALPPKDVRVEARKRGGKGNRGRRRGGGGLR